MVAHHDRHRPRRMSNEPPQQIGTEKKIRRPSAISFMKLSQGLKDTGSLGRVIVGLLEFAGKFGIVSVEQRFRCLFLVKA